MHEEVPPFEMNADAQEYAMNALISYEELINRGEPLSSFERLMLNRLDIISADQRAYHKMAEARF